MHGSHRRCHDDALYPALQSGDGDNFDDDVLGGDDYDDVLGGGGVTVQEKFQSSVSEGIPGSKQVLKITYYQILMWSLPALVGNN